MYSYTAWPKKNRKSNRQGQKTRAQKRPKKYKVKKRKIMSMKIKENRWKTSFFEPPGKVDWKKVQRRKRASKIHQVRNGLMYKCWNSICAATPPGKKFDHLVASKTNKDTTSNKHQKKDRKEHKRIQKRQKTQIFPKDFLRPSPALSGPIPGFSPEFPAAGSEKIFPAPGRRWPERAGENTKNHFNLAPAVSQFHGCCRIAPAYCFGTNTIFS